MKKIKWGIIGCGNVTEFKSGPAFNKVQNSSLVAVMRRNADKAADYAFRHNIARWYNDADKLINDPEVNAIYIATPPSSHEEYSLAAINAGKPVYVEKPMTLNSASAKRMIDTARAKNVKLVVAHYRREWPLFKKLKELIEDKAIGELIDVNLRFNKTTLTVNDLKDERMAWRVNPAISGGGLFHDLAPHQLDIMYQLFGEEEQISGIAVNTGGLYKAADTVSGKIKFSNNIRFVGNWNFNSATDDDLCEITGSRGKLVFSFFKGNSIDIHINNHIRRLEFDYLQHVQEPMIEKTVQHFLGQADNPCNGDSGVKIMQWMDAMTSI